MGSYCFNFSSTFPILVLRETERSEMFCRSLESSLKMSLATSTKEANCRRALLNVLLITASNSQSVTRGSPDSVLKLVRLKNRGSTMRCTKGIFCVVPLTCYQQTHLFICNNNSHIHISQTLPLNYSGGTSHFLGKLDGREALSTLRLPDCECREPVSR